MDQALKALDIDKMDARDAAKLKTAYKTASMKHHPDRGGDVEKMKDVTLAYELLSKYAGTSSSASTSSSGGSFDRKSYDDSRKEYL